MHVYIILYNIITCASSHTHHHRQDTKQVRHWWLIPVIPATGEAEIGRIMV
jgi:hypothetical protein